MFSEIVYLVNDAVAVQANSAVIIVLREPSGLPGPGIIFQRGDACEHAASVGIGRNRLLFPHDGRFNQNLITCHAFADPKQMTRT
jgi:hypothetical protein